MLAFRTAAAAEVESAPTLPDRPKWTTSRVVGSPDPPPPFTVEPAFTEIAWKNPVFAIREPGTEYLIVVEWPQPRTTPPEAHHQQDADVAESSRFEPAPVFRVLDRPGRVERRSFFTLENRIIYSLAFHPDYERNGQIFVCSKTHDPAPWTNIVSRFVASPAGPDAPHRWSGCDPSTEEVILEWKSEGHDGGAVVFGHDGMLYVTTGDGSGDSDTWYSAQDASNLQGSVLRLDVDHPAQGQPYAIPSDNPFVDLAGVRGEIWSLGHRNPWRMCVDERTGHLWVGNNGQDLWEYAHLIRRGDNCGWSVLEGSHPFYLNRQRGPGSFAPPTVEHHHSEFRSLTGGVVYYGKALPDLEGAYVYGDYSTGAIWGVKHDGKQVVWNRELARTTLDIVGFATSPNGELLVLDYTEGLFRMKVSPPDESHESFPRRLSETGLFSSVKDHLAAAGVIPYSVNAPGWSDGASSDRLLGVPAAARIKRTATGGWEFPDGAVIAQTLSLGDGETRRARATDRDANPDPPERRLGRLLVPLERFAG